MERECHLYMRRPATREKPRGTNKEYHVYLERRTDGLDRNSFEISYVVYAEWGRRGARLTRTIKGAFNNRYQAEKLFDKVVTHEQDKGYQMLTPNTAPPQVTWIDCQGCGFAHRSTEAHSCDPWTRGLKRLKEIKSKKAESIPTTLITNSDGHRRIAWDGDV